jgi:hypothetical protein
MVHSRPLHDLLACLSVKCPTLYVVLLRCDIFHVILLFLLPVIHHILLVSTHLSPPVCSVSCNEVCLILINLAVPYEGVSKEVTD